MLVTGGIITFQGTAYAQSSDYEKTQSLVKTGETKTAMEQALEMEKLLGHVTEIKIGGAPSTHKSVILRQLTFKVGDTIHMKDLALSYKRLNQLGLFWYVQIRYEPVGKKPSETEPVKEGETPKESETPKEIEKSGVITGTDEKQGGGGDIIVYVSVYQAPSYYAYPFESGGILGDKDIFLSGKTAEVGYFQSGKEFRYWYMQYIDPQFNGSHNSGTLTISHLKDLYGVRNEKSFDLGERYTLQQDTISFMLGTRYKEDYNVNFGVELQKNDTRYRGGTIYANSNRFFLSDQEFTPGTEIIPKFTISRSAGKGYPWKTKGYSWSLGTDQAVSGLGSEYTFGRYKATGTAYLPCPSLIDVAVIHGEYSTTSGNPPHYQKPRLGYLMRGHTNLDYFGDSTIYLSGELRKAFLGDRFQGVVFVDLGKGFDRRILSFEDLDVSSGLGVRINVAKFLPLNIILRADYAWGLNGERWTFGIGQWFY